MKQKYMKRNNHHNTLHQHLQPHHISPFHSICTQTHTHTHTHTYIHNHLQTHTHTRTRTDTETHRHTDTQTRRHTHKHTYAHIHTHTHTHKHTRTHRHPHVHAHMHRSCVYFHSGTTTTHKQAKAHQSLSVRILRKDICELSVFNFRFSATHVISIAPMCNRPYTCEICNRLFEIEFLLISSQ